MKANEEYTPEFLLKNRYREPAYMITKKEFDHSDDLFCCWRKLCSETEFKAIGAKRTLEEAKELCQLDKVVFPKDVKIISTSL